MSMSEQEREQMVTKLVDTYLNDSEVCMAETLASEIVPAGITYEEAFFIYIKAMNRVEGDKFYAIKEGEHIKLN